MSVSLFRRDDAVSRVLFAEAGLIAGGFQTDTVMLDRRDVHKVVWRQALARGWEPSNVVKDLVIGGGLEDTQALSLADGSVAWQVGARGGLTVLDTVVFRCDGGLRVIEGITGQTRAETPTAVEWLQACGNICLFAPSGHTNAIGGFDPGRVSVLWQHALLAEMDDARTAPLPHEFVGPHAYTRVMWAGNENFIVLRVGEPKGASLFLCDTRTGAIQWHANPRLDTYAVTVIDSRVVVPKWKGVSLLDLATGVLVADLTPPEMVKGTHPRPAVAYRGRVAIPYETGHIAVYDVAAAALVHVVQTKHRFNRAIEADGRLILGTFNGSLVVYDDSIWGFD